MGDSLTDKRHWANREVAWVDLLQDRIKAEVRLRRDDREPRDRRHATAAEPRPDPALARAGARAGPGDDLLRRQRLGRRHARRGVPRACEDAVDRVRRATRGKADVLLLTTNPSATRWTETAELAEACRRAPTQGLRTGRHRSSVPRRRQRRSRSSLRRRPGPPQPRRSRSRRRHGAESDRGGIAYRLRCVLRVRRGRRPARRAARS